MERCKLICLVFVSQRQVRPLCLVQPDFEAMIRQFILTLGLRLPNSSGSDSSLCHQIVSLLHIMNSMEYPDMALNYGMCIKQ